MKLKHAVADCALEKVQSHCFILYTGQGFRKCCFSFGSWASSSEFPPLGHFHNPAKRAQQSKKKKDNIIYIGRTVESDAVICVISWILSWTRIFWSNKHNASVWLLHIYLILQYFFILFLTSLLVEQEICPRLCTALKWLEVKLLI